MVTFNSSPAPDADRPGGGRGGNAQKAVSHEEVKTAPVFETGAV